MIPVNKIISYSVFVYLVTVIVKIKSNYGVFGFNFMSKLIILLRSKNKFDV